MKSEIKVILPAGKIPQGEIVSKITGTYKYNIHDSIVIYHEVKNERQPIIAEKGTRFMTDHSGHISCISDEKELVWHTELADLRRWLNKEMGVQENED
jgi:hypothetical protein